jgi:hypothetical protein
MRLELFVLLIALANFVLVIEFVRRRLLGESFAIVWGLVAVAGIVLVALRPLIDAFAEKVGIADGTAVVFSGGILFLLILSLYLSMHITKLEDRVERLAEEVAMLRGVRGGEGPPEDDTLHAGPDLRT